MDLFYRLTIGKKGRLFLVDWWNADKVAINPWHELRKATMLEF